MNYRTRRTQKQTKAILYKESISWWIIGLGVGLGVVVGLGVGVGIVVGVGGRVAVGIAVGTKYTAVGSSTGVGVVSVTPGVKTVTTSRSPYITTSAIAPLLLSTPDQLIPYPDPEGYAPSVTLVPLS